MFIEEVARLEAELRNRRTSDTNSKTQLESLVKEKDELLEIIMRRGKLIQVLVDCFYYLPIMC